jgi:hypothetical protein
VRTEKTRWPVLSPVFCALVAGATSGAAGTQTESHCSLIEDNGKRVACHIRKPIKPPRDWLVLKSNYFKSVTVSKTATYEVKCGEKVGTTSILFICAKKQTSLVLSTSCALGKKGDQHTAQFSLDDQEPSAMQFVVPKNTFALSNKDAATVSDLAKSIQGHKLMHVKITPPSGAAYNATFDLAGFDKKIKPLRTACGWK